MLSDKLKHEIALHAVEEYPNECCGFVLDGGDYVRLKNISKQPDKHFKVDPKDYLEYESKLAGVVHSHVNGDPTPSHDDMVFQKVTSVPWIIAGTNSEMCTKFQIFGWQIVRKDFLGLEFVHGVNDCYSLIRNYYYTYFDALIPDFPRGDNWWLQQENSMYVDNFSKAGFVEVSKDDIKEHDVLLMRMGRTKSINHAGVACSGAELIAHHVHNRLSCREPLMNYANKIEKVLRYDATSDTARTARERVRYAVRV